MTKKPPVTVVRLGKSVHDPRSARKVALDGGGSVVVVIDWRALARRAREYMDSGGQAALSRFGRGVQVRYADAPPLPPPPTYEQRAASFNPGPPAPPIDPSTPWV